MVGLEKFWRKGVSLINTLLATRGDSANFELMSFERTNKN